MDFEKIAREATDKLESTQKDAAEHVRAAMALGKVISNNMSQFVVSEAIEKAKLLALMSLRQKYAGISVKSLENSKLSDEFHDMVLTILCGTISEFLLMSTSCDPTTLDSMLDLVRKTVQINFTINWMVAHGKDPTSGDQGSSPTGD